ncbi:MAG: DUF2748 domain-containing protein [Rickettsiales bacterium]|nr:MAG: DUF2748 domain-containing protein [Rickettsiales bacterium]
MDIEVSSIYHILNQIPAIYKEEMLIEQEELVNLLMDSGQIRIDTNYYCNYVHYTDNHSKINLIFSVDEITKPNLIEASKQRLKNIYISKKKTLTEEKIISIIDNLNKDASKLLLVSEELKFELTRMVVQSAHPIIFKWILLDKVEIFITYSHNIGDVMDMANWKNNGRNSGMQSTDGRNVCVYVSCGGDPFAANNPQQLTVGDGWAAAARLQIIAGQELVLITMLIRPVKTTLISPLRIS